MGTHRDDGVACDDLRLTWNWGSGLDGGVLDRPPLHVYTAHKA